MLVLQSKDIRPELQKISRNPTEESLKTFTRRASTNDLEDEWDFIDFDESTVDAVDAQVEKKNKLANQAYMN